MVPADGRVIPRFTYLSGVFWATVRGEHSEGMDALRQATREREISRR
jgi:hypothetical protein